MKILNMHSSPIFYYFFPHTCSLCPQHSIFHLSLCSSLDVRDKVSHLYRITNTVIGLYFLLLCFWIENGRTRFS